MLRAVPTTVGTSLMNASRISSTNPTNAESSATPNALRSAPVKSPFTIRSNRPLNASPIRPTTADTPDSAPSPEPIPDTNPRNASTAGFTAAAHPDSTGITLSFTSATTFARIGTNALPSVAFRLFH